MAIKGIIKIELSKELILSKISEYAIFSHYMPHNWKLNVATYSAFRKENVKSFCIFCKNDKLYYKDFAQTEHKGNCFTFVQQLFHIVEYKDVLIKIAQDFNIIQNNKIVNSEIIIKYKQPEIKEKEKTVIQVVTKEFTEIELEYWNSFHITLQDLKDNNIFSVKELYLNRQKFVIDHTELKFGYYNNKSWKIYTPFSKDKNFKWFPNNTPITTMYGLENIKDNCICFITKSLKDYIVCKKVYDHVCAVQNEGSGCFSEENIKYLKGNSSTQILSFDSDDPGVKNSQIITKKYDFDYFNVPRTYLLEGINDWAALGSKYGLKKVKKLINDKIKKLKNE